MKKCRFSLLGAALIYALYQFCGPSVVDHGGSGTETIGGILVDTLGVPVTNAIVHLSALSTTPARYSDFTNDTGAYCIENIPAGAYAREAYTEDSSLILTKDTIVYTNDTFPLLLGIDTMYAPGMISGLVFCGDSAVRHIHAYIPGTSYSAYTNDSGYYCITNIPAGVYQLAFNYPGYQDELDSSVVVFSGTITRHKEKHLTISFDGPPPTPSSLNATYDTLIGVMTLTWAAVAVSDLQEYYIYRKTVTDSSAMQKIGVATDLVYYDTLFIDPLDTHSVVLRYQITALDTLANESNFSSAIIKTAASPTVIRTFFTWTVVPDSSDTIFIDQKTVIVVFFSNKTRKNTVIRWYTDNALQPVHISSPNTTDGYDTLTCAWPDSGSHTLRIEAIDERGSVWRDSCVVSVNNGITPKNVWTEVTPLHQARRFCTAVAVDDNLYAFGGTADFFNGTGWVPNYLGSVETYSFTDSTWSLNTTPSARSAATTVAYAGKIYIIGGIDQGVVSQTMDVYTVATGAWEKAVSIPFKRYGHAACVYHDSLFIFGGFDGSSRITDTIFRFNLVLNQWAVRGTMSVPRAYHQAVTLQNSIYILGGLSDQQTAQATNTVDIFSPSANMMMPGIPMTSARMNFGAAAVDNKIYIMGGLTSFASTVIYATVEMYDPRANQWAIKKSLPQARHSFGVCMFNKSIFIIGGSDTINKQFDYGQLRSVLQYFP